MSITPPNGVPLAQRRKAPNPGTERRALAIDIPAGADDELAAMAAIVATVEALPAPGRLRVLEWAYERYVRAARLRLVASDESRHPG
jgi:hypothetical protein